MVFPAPVSGRFISEAITRLAASHQTKKPAVPGRGTVGPRWRVPATERSECSRSPRLRWLHPPLPPGVRNHCLAVDTPGNHVRLARGRKNLAKSGEIACVRAGCAHNMRLGRDTLPNWGPAGRQYFRDVLCALLSCPERGPWISMQEAPQGAGLGRRTQRIASGALSNLPVPALFTEKKGVQG